MVEYTHAKITWPELEGFCVYREERFIPKHFNSGIKDFFFPACQFNVTANRCCRLQCPVWAKLTKVYSHKPELEAPPAPPESYYSKFGLVPNAELWKCPACGHIQDAEKPACENCGKARP